MSKLYLLEVFVIWLIFTAVSTAIAYVFAAFVFWNFNIGWTLFTTLALMSGVWVAIRMLIIGNSKRGL